LHFSKINLFASFIQIKTVVAYFKSTWTPIYVYAMKILNPRKQEKSEREIKVVKVIILPYLINDALPIILIKSRKVDSNANKIVYRRRACFFISSKLR
jgi:hypothetical protein